MRDAHAHCTHDALHSPRAFRASPCTAHAAGTGRAARAPQVEPPYYTIMADGIERQTEGDRLFIEVHKKDKPHPDPDANLAPTCSNLTLALTPT